MKMTQLKDKVAIVTGGSRGIGSSIALELAKNGVKIVINYNSNSEAADKMVAEINELGGKHMLYKLMFQAAKMQQDLYKLLLNVSVN